MAIDLNLGDGNVLNCEWWKSESLEHILMHTVFVDYNHERWTWNFSALVCCVKMKYISSCGVS